MDGQVVKNDDIALVQRGRKLRLNVEVEHLTIHGALEDPGRVKPVVAQRGDKCLRVPMAMRRVVDQAFPARRPAGLLDHVGLQGCLVDEGQPVQEIDHEGLSTVDPESALTRHFRAALFSSAQCFFYG